LQSSTGDVLISAITVAELYFGVAKSSRPEANAVALEQFLQPLSVIDFSPEDAICYGGIRAMLQKKGTIIGAMDMLIAAQAVNQNLILITNNEKEFKRVIGLKIENWAKAPLNR
jgi:tRNA(fMet)-specific endonuclease VapC